jgi:phosphoglycolate phosphatase
MPQETTDELNWRNLRLFIFDLDGTLIDSKLDLALSVNATRTQFGLGPLPHEQIFGYIGDGAPMLVRRALDHTADDALVAQALPFFLGHYREHMLDNTVPYPGVREGLEGLTAGGRLLAVLTNKPERISGEILRGLGLGDFFRSLYGGNSPALAGRKKPDPLGVELLRRDSGASKGETLFVGDSEIDVQTARNAGVRVAGVTYGLGSERLRDHPPDLLISSLAQLAALVNK